MNEEPAEANRTGIPFPFPFRVLTVLMLCACTLHTMYIQTTTGTARQEQRVDAWP
jgi:hypothetical protein